MIGHPLPIMTGSERDCTDGAKMTSVDDAKISLHTEFSVFIPQRVVYPTIQSPKLDIMFGKGHDNSL